MCINEIRPFFDVAIKSILQQEYAEKYELVLINDGYSTEIIQEYIESKFSKYNNFKYIKLFHNQKNIGLTKSLNLGINLCKGEFIVRQDDDDISHLNRLLVVNRILSKNNDLKLISSSFEIINEKNKIQKTKKITKQKVLSKHLYKNIISHSSVVFNKKFIIDIGKYNEKFLYTQDYELWNRIIIKNPDLIYFSDKFLVKIRYHKDSISNTKALEQRFNSLKVCLASKYHEYYNDIVYADDSNIHKVVAQFENRKISNYFYALKFTYLYEEKFREKFNFQNIFFISKIFMKNYQLFFKNIYFRIFIK